MKNRHNQSLILDEHHFTLQPGLKSTHIIWKTNRFVTGKKPIYPKHMSKISSIWATCLGQRVNEYGDLEILQFCGL